MTLDPTLNTKIVQAIMIHFETGANSCEMPLFPENSLKDVDAFPKWLEIRISTMSKKLVSQQWVINLAVNLLCSVRSGTVSAPDQSIYDVEDIIGCIESMFTPITVPGVGCMDFPEEDILGLQTTRPFEVVAGLTKASVTGFYKLEVN